MTARRVVEARALCVTLTLPYIRLTSQVALRQLRVKKLPPVLSFQLKVGRCNAVA